MKLYFVRHTAVDVPNGTCYGQTDVPLKDSFEEEAEKVRQAIDKIHFDRSFSSPFSRCTKLANYCGFHTPEQKEELKEMNFGEWEMKKWDEITDQHINDWYANWIDCPTAEGESFQMQYNRVASFLNELLLKPFENIIIFTHAGVINCARVYFGETTLREAFEWTPSFGEIVLLKKTKY